VNVPHWKLPAHIMSARLSIATLSACGVAFLAGMYSRALLQWARTRFNPRHQMGSEAHEIEAHIRSTQVPAEALGIVVDEMDGSSLTLSAPLTLNRNVHGTAFAGSLYAVGVLCSYYLGRSWSRRQGLAAYELVAKRGRIEYKRPAKSERIVARSWLPPAEELDAFRQTLEREGKAFIDVEGSVLSSDGKICCEYSVNVCAFRPRV
jgi:thioesterase domain-containing protein